MQVEMRIRGVATRVAAGAFPELEVCVAGSNTLVTGEARDEADALSLIERARSVGLGVVSWRLIEPASGER